MTVRKRLLAVADELHEIAVSYGLRNRNLDRRRVAKDLAYLSDAVVAVSREVEHVPPPRPTDGATT